MAIRHVCALVLLGAGALVLLVSVLAFVVLPRPFARLHALSPASSLGLPLVALASAVETGPGRAALKLLFIAGVAAFAGSVTTMALARARQEEAAAPGWKEPS
ncbi:monovalent cation/H(+) antiporter subunit G [Streptomyces sp. KL116D]|uniref:monovalent cation/H(+) antiporter subunit G n=1 Tax=Streptomyces sp. KL116D TaxID=3045152 RepID=UPI003556863B